MRGAAVLAVVLSLVLVVPGQAMAASKGGAPSVTFERFAFTSTSTGTVASADGRTLTLGGTLTPGTYDDPFGASGIAYDSGYWVSGAVATPFAFDELVASWNADTPEGKWLRVEMQATGSGRTTKWYTLGIWASGDATIHRTSVPAQGDGDGFIAIDTFIRSKKAAPLTSYQLKITLYRVQGSPLAPTVTFTGAMTSAASDFSVPSTFSGVVKELAVPRLSQEVHMGHFPEYDNGGEAWCSPTSTAMVLDYWKYGKHYANSGPTDAQLDAWPEIIGHTDRQVDYAARYVYDYNYRGAGNWPYNTAYAATFGLNGFVTRLRSLAEAERFINADIPLVASINGKLPGFLFKKTSGHLLVIIGFTASGDVIANDPAVFANEDARKIYSRADFEEVWLGGSAGIVYVIYPAGLSLPPPVGGGLPANW